MHGSGAASGSVTAVSSVTKLVISRGLQLAPEEFLLRLFYCLEAQHEPWSGACRNVMNDARVQLTRACLGETVLTPQPRCIDVSRLVVDAMVCAAWPSAQYERGSSSFTVRDWRVGRKTQGCQKVSAGRWFWLRSALFLGTRRVRSSNAHSPSRR
ncbi:hypothetical protein IG631_18997 [Alternaria alternata]|nr:hypothetical protein IG631_18997 [Alternaria alternata]